MGERRAPLGGESPPAWQLGQPAVDPPREMSRSHYLEELLGVAEELLDRAGVGRSTFYVHYRDKNAA